MQTSRNIKKHFISRILKLKLKIDLSDKNRAPSNYQGALLLFWVIFLYQNEDKHEQKSIN